MKNQIEFFTPQKRSQLLLVIGKTCLEIVNRYHAFKAACQEFFEANSKTIEERMEILFSYYRKLGYHSNLFIGRFAYVEGLHQVPGIKHLVRIRQNEIKGTAFIFSAYLSWVSGTDLQKIAPKIFMHFVGVEAAKYRKEMKQKFENNEKGESKPKEKPFDYSKSKELKSFGNGDPNLGKELWEKEGIGPVGF